MFVRRSLTAVLAASLCATGLAVVATPAAAAAERAKQRDPIASKVTFRTTAIGVTMSGWAFDPDAPAQNLKIRAAVDGKTATPSVPTSLARTGISSRYAVGPTPGYSLAVPVPTGKHIVCAILSNIGGGLSVVKKCVATPLGRKLTAKQVAKRSPRGAIQTATASRGKVRLIGWASDPDFLQQRRRLQVYLNGSATPSKLTKNFTGARPKGAGKGGRFDITLPVANTSQLACVWVPNVGIGKRVFLGCRVLDPRGVSTSTTRPATPVANTKLLALAKKQIGKRYVWAAAGPKAFDCSGLVMWSYRKNGLTTPRVAADQRRAARVVPLARAVPGDLVFYNDTSGHVFHVGIFIKPGLSVAAISTDQGVDYQRINAATATYGSFTHT